jgi:hypothetical protein
LLLLPFLVFGQGAAGVEMTFQSDAWLLGFPVYSIGICNTTDEPRSFSSIIVRNAARARKIRPLTYAATLELIERSERMSLPRILASAGEVGGYIAGAGTTTGLFCEECSDIVKALPLLGAGALRLGKALVDRHATPVELPEDILPLWISLDAGYGSCAEYRFFAYPGAEQ